MSQRTHTPEQRVVQLIDMMDFLLTSAEKHMDNQVSYRASKYREDLKEIKEEIVAEFPDKEIDVEDLVAQNQTEPVKAASVSAE